MIGVLANDTDKPVAAEFFELFKTPWQFWHPQFSGDVLLTNGREAPPTTAKLMIVFGSGETECDRALRIRLDATASGTMVRDGEAVFPVYGSVASFDSRGEPLLCRHGDSQAVAVRLERGDSVVIRVGFDLFAEVRHLITSGQPSTRAPMPALDWVIGLLRRWILERGLALVEIPPVPAGHRFFACLTHDVDFIGIRQHHMDHTLFGFLYRASLGSLVAFLRGRFSAKKLLKNWLAIAKLPLIHLGWARDFWDDFGAYRDIERDFPSTFFIIPFKNRAGEHLGMPHPQRRATRYDVENVAPRLRSLIEQGFEIGLHGIDAWHSPEAAGRERQRITGHTGQTRLGIRMHWLCYDPGTPRILDDAGFDYDATFGYNDTVGYRAGTTQPFQPPGTRHLLELPLHIQDVALFTPASHSPSDAWSHCWDMVERAGRQGGVLTVLWHTRSLGPERFWGDFYKDLIRLFIENKARVANAQTVIDWFRLRRAVRFEDYRASPEEIEVRLAGISPDDAGQLVVRVHPPNGLALAPARTAPFTDFPLRDALVSPLRFSINGRA